MKQIAGLGLILALVDTASAADLQRAATPMPTAPSSDGLIWFGEAWVGLQGLFGQPSGGGRTVSVPYVDLGGKIALQPGNSPFGAQFELQYSGLDIGWISPSLRARGGAGDLRGIAHATWLASDRTKFGLFAGMQDDYFNTGKKSNLALYTWRAGIDGLYVASPTTTWFGHLAYLDPWYLTASGDSATDNTNTTWGWQIGGGVDYKVAPDWKLGGSLDLTRMVVRGEGSAMMVDLGAKVEKALGSVPGIVALNLAWRPVVTHATDGGDTTTTHTFGVGMRYTYRFGAPETSAATTLLRY